MTDLSILIPARQEQFLFRTIQDILANIQADSEIIVVLDGAWADPPIPDHERVTLIYHPESIGQRAATNEAARMAKGKYVMKCDAHCAFAPGFDVALIQDGETLGKDVTQILRMYNLHAFDWICNDCGERTYQGPKKCPKCGSVNMTMDVIWQPRMNRRTDFARFDHEIHFQYWSSYEKRPEARGDIADVMCCVGACWFMRRERFWELDGMDEATGSWGQMGVELSLKNFTSGGRQVVNKKTWFAHLFRTQPGFGFPYPISYEAQERAREYSRNMWINNNWEKAIHPLSWVLEKFWPIPGWSDEDLINQKRRERTEKGTL